MTSTGVFDSEPLSMDQELYRGSLEIGTIDSLTKLYDVLSLIKDDFPANEYNVIRRNWNHFSDEFWRKLVGTGIPGYINRLANLGVCFLYKSLFKYSILPFAEYLKLIILNIDMLQLFNPWENVEPRSSDK